MSKGVIAVVLEPDVAAVFKSSEAVGQRLAAVGNLCDALDRPHLQAVVVCRGHGLLVPVRFRVPAVPQTNTCFAQILQN